MNKIFKMCAAGLFLTLTSHAANINWNTAQTISGDTDVSKNGVQVFGVSFTSESSGSRTVNGEVFNFYNAGAGRGDAVNTSGASININSYMTDTFSATAVGAFGQGTTFEGLSEDYQKVLNDALYDSAASDVITFTNLTVGSEYEIQLWAMDCRVNKNATSFLELDGDGTVGSGTLLDFNVSNDLSNAQTTTYVADGIGQWITGTFVADATSQTFLMDGYRATEGAEASMQPVTGKRQLQALQLRLISGTIAVVTPSTTAGYAPLEVVFDGSGSASDGNIIDYSWDFGDGNVASGVVVTNTYTSADDFTASLTVTDDLGGIASNSLVITVESQPLEVVATAAPASGTAPLAVVFDASTSVPSAGGSITSYSWNFGDGNSDNGVTVTHTYTATGTYTAELVVADSNGQIDTNTMTIVVHLPSDGTYSDTFDNDGLALNAGSGGGMKVYIPQASKAIYFADDGNLTGVITAPTDGAARGAVYSTNAFQITEGFTLDVVYNVNLIDTTIADTATFGLVDEVGNLDGLFVDASKGITGLGISLTTRGGGAKNAQGLIELDADGVTLTNLSNAQLISSGIDKTFSLTVQEDGSFSYSIDGAPATTGTTTLDLSKDYHFAAYTQRNAGFAIQSISLIPINNVTEIGDVSIELGSGTEAVFSWYGEFQANYELQVRDNLVIGGDEAWVTVTNVAGADTIISITDEMDKPTEFYRVKLAE
ncbi:PKD domain-containing protein [Pontiellaceae bacterium B12219]|nr:PKD domain-containing protein [Pontiellaceae bacterium B12219]